MTISDSSPSKPKRRWCQFSLRTLLLLTVVVAIGCSWFAWRLKQARRQQRGSLIEDPDNQSFVQEWYGYAYRLE